MGECGAARQAIEADLASLVIYLSGCCQLNAVVTQVIETVAASQPEELPATEKDKKTEE